MTDVISINVSHRQVMNLLDMHIMTISQSTIVFFPIPYCNSTISKLNSYDIIEYHLNLETKNWLSDSNIKWKHNHGFSGGCSIKVHDTNHVLMIILAFDNIEYSESSNDIAYIVSS